MAEQKTTYTLEMLRPDELQPKHVDLPGLEIRQVGIPCAEFNWFLHQVVGADFRWAGRDDWDKAEWAEYVGRAALETWVLYLSGTPAGYFELEKQGDGSVRLVNFGLRRPFFGRGLGGHLLTNAVTRAWQLGATHVWLRTCSHDHEHALPNYLARGFRVVETTTGPANRPSRPAFE